MQQTILQAADLILDAQGLIVLTGAGMGADSGIPTYRGVDGSWGKIQGELQMPIEMVMNPAFVQANLGVMWDRFIRRIHSFQMITPHKGFDVLNHIGTQIFQDNYFHITSNIDGQLQKAGVSSAQILEIHGNIHYLQCTTPCQTNTWPVTAAMLDAVPWQIPTCPHCGAFTRPNVLLFQDNTFVRARVKNQQAVFEQFKAARWSQSFVLLEIGAGVQVKAIRLFSARLAQQLKAPLIRINPYDSLVENPRHVSIALPALEALQALAEHIKT
ncbi:MAG TPA: hypothetical protein DCM08_07875 [Microscillaceae bacterium]|nr:hypothetical protein [Microscillaceae bacterium]